MFRFGFPDVLYAYAAIPLLLAFLWYAAKARRKALFRFAQPELAERLDRSVSRRARVIKRFLVVAALLLLVSAMARPQFGTRVETVRREGRDVIVAIDVSASMLAEDVAPNRLEKAKLAVASLLNRFEGDRVGLVVFAGQAFVQAPLTVDYAAATMFLRSISPSLVPVPGTDMREALTRAIDAFDDKDREYRVLIIVSDGEDHSDAYREPLERAVSEGIVIYTIGIGGTAGVPIPQFDATGNRQGFLRDSAGGVVLTRLEEGTLEQMATESGGRYVRITNASSQLNELADDIAGLGKREIDTAQFTQYEEQFQILLGAALILLTAESFVPERRRVTGEWKGRFE
jgi:Ca-activated chloride channel homolog